MSSAARGDPPALFVCLVPAVARRGRAPRSEFNNLLNNPDLWGEKNLPSLSPTAELICSEICQDVVACWRGIKVTRGEEVVIYLVLLDAIFP